MSSFDESDADPAAKIHFEVGADPPDPDGNSATFASPLQVTSSQKIKALVLDGAGNESPVESFVYTIDTAKPSIVGLKPPDGSRTRDRTPTISATVTDDQSELSNSDVQLFVNGKPLTKFDYDQGTGLLSATIPRLSFGRHTVKLIATDAATNSKEQRSSFEVVKKR